MSPGVPEYRSLGQRVRSIGILRAVDGVFQVAITSLISQIGGAVVRLSSPLVSNTDRLHKSWEHQNDLNE